MNKVPLNPFRNLHLDQEEKEINEAIEMSSTQPVKNLAKEKRRFQSVAKFTLGKVRNINIRLTSWDLQKLKEKAMGEGIPYQTLASSILHKYVGA